jgi:hypothetical protein
MPRALGFQLGNVVFLETEFAGYKYKFNTCPLEA